MPTQLWKQQILLSLGVKSKVKKKISQEQFHSLLIRDNCKIKVLVYVPTNNLIK